MFRHGDLLIETAAEIPPEAKNRPDKVLAYGTATGHVHRLIGGEVLETEGVVHLHITEDGARLVHTIGLTDTLTKDHNTIELPINDYVVIRQREYDPYERAVRQVAD